MMQEQHISNQLLKWFAKNGRTLPWRGRRLGAYEIWVSEIMLQQTQVSRVEKYYTRFLKRFPDLATLAKSSWEEFLPYYEGLGYYARGRNMLKTAQLIVAKNGGRFPRDKAILMKLPGVGEYTASAIRSFAYGENDLAIDTNFKRVFGRIFGGSKVAVFDEDAILSAIPKGKSATFNAAVMDFGSLVCARKPACSACPLAAVCRYRQEAGKGEVVTKNRSSVIHKTQHEKVIVILHENHKKYFSLLKSRYEPFLMPQGVETRGEIKQYFQNTHNLTVSVRPPRAPKRGEVQSALYTHVQILKGKPAFYSFTKQEIKKELYN